MTFDIHSGVYTRVILKGMFRLKEFWSYSRKKQVKTINVPLFIIRHKMQTVTFSEKAINILSLFKVIVKNGTVAD